MKRSALFALTALLASTALANAFTPAPQSAPSGVQLAMEKDKMSKDEKMSKDKMKKDKMKKDSMKKDSMMKKDEMKK
jgi:pentapeptide MXKDX repeat protein